MPFGSRIITKQVKKNRQQKGNTADPEKPSQKLILPDTLKKIKDMANPVDNKPKKKTSFDESLHKFKEFIVSPTGIVVVIGLIILGHYAYKGFKADGGKGK